MLSSAIVCLGSILFVYVRVLLIPVYLFSVLSFSVLFCSVLYWSDAVPCIGILSCLVLSCIARARILRSVFLLVPRYVTDVNVTTIIADGMHVLMLSPLPRPMSVCSVLVFSHCSSVLVIRFQSMWCGLFSFTYFSFLSCPFRHLLS